MITLENIVKEYDKKIVLRDINMTIERGQSIAITGHNGCGKSTLLKVIAGLVQPTKGKLNCESHYLFHYVPEHFPQLQLTAETYLLSQGRIEGIAELELRNKIQSLSQDFYLQSMLDTPMKLLSKGSLQKVGVIQALLTEPDILLLDEPLSGQDSASQQVFIDKINALKKSGTVILMSCHEPYLINAISDCVYQLDNGLLNLVTQRNIVEDKWYVLFFTKGKQCSVPERWQGHLQYVENGCRLRVEEKECNILIMEMLQAGWNLRGMFDEANI